jgi:hypothetical protein
MLTNKEFLHAKIDLIGGGAIPAKATKEQHGQLEKFGEYISVLPDKVKLNIIKRITHVYHSEDDGLISYECEMDIYDNPKDPFGLGENWAYYKPIPPRRQKNASVPPEEPRKKSEIKTVPVAPKPIIKPTPPPRVEPVKAEPKPITQEPIKPPSPKESVKAPPVEAPQPKRKLKTIAEFAQEESVTVQTVYRRLDRQMKRGEDGLTEKVKSITYLTAKGEELLRGV